MLSSLTSSSSMCISFMWSRDMEFKVYYQLFFGKKAISLSLALDSLNPITDLPLPMNGCVWHAFTRGTHLTGALSPSEWGAEGALGTQKKIGQVSLHAWLEYTCSWGKKVRVVCVWGASLPVCRTWGAVVEISLPKHENSCLNGWGEFSGSQFGAIFAHICQLLGLLGKISRMCLGKAIQKIRANVLFTNDKNRPVREAQKFSTSDVPPSPRSGLLLNDTGNFCNHESSLARQTFYSAVSLRVLCHNPQVSDNVVSERVMCELCHMSTQDLYWLHKNAKIWHSWPSWCTVSITQPSNHFPRSVVFGMLGHRMGDHVTGVLPSSELGAKGTGGVQKIFDQCPLHAWQEQTLA